jgi:hypothetical protein
MRVLLALIACGVLAIFAFGELQRRSSESAAAPAPTAAGAPAAPSPGGLASTESGAVGTGGIGADAGAGPVAGGEEAAVMEAFSAFRSALMGRRGPGVAGVVTESTLHYYDQVASMAATAERPIIESQPFLTQVMIYRVRQLVPADRLRELTGQGLLSHAVQQGWTGTSVARMSIREVRVFSQTASATTRAGDRAGPTIQFRREGGRWKVDLAQMIGYLNDALEEEILRSGRSPRDVLAALAGEGG